MLGEKLAESSGKIIGTRLLPFDGQSVRVEVTFQGGGTILGMDMTEMSTYVQTLRPGGALNGEGEVLFTTLDGEMALWKGAGVGAATGPAPAGKFAVYGSFVMASPKLARLTTMAVVTEYESDQEGNYHYESWEWK